jgi:hypothetical protein
MTIPTNDPRPDPDWEDAVYYGSDSSADDFDSKMIALEEEINDELAGWLFYEQQIEKLKARQQPIRKNIEEIALQLRQYTDSAIVAPGVHIQSTPKHRIDPEKAYEWVMRNPLGNAGLLRISAEAQQAVIGLLLDNPRFAGAIEVDPAAYRAAYETRQKALIKGDLIINDMPIEIEEVRQIVAFTVKHMNGIEAKAPIDALHVVQLTDTSYRSEAFRSVSFSHFKEAPPVINDTLTDRSDQSHTDTNDLRSILADPQEMGTLRSEFVAQDPDFGDALRDALAPLGMRVERVTDPDQFLAQFRTGGDAEDTQEDQKQAPEEGDDIIPF